MHHIVASQDKPGYHDYKLQATAVISDNDNRVSVKNNISYSNYIVVGDDDKYFCISS